MNIELPIQPLPLNQTLPSALSTVPLSSYNLNNLSLPLNKTDKINSNIEKNMDKNIDIDEKNIDIDEKITNEIDLSEYESDDESDEYESDELAEIGELEREMVKNQVTVTHQIIDHEASFFATFSDGSGFRNMIEYLRLINVEGVFRFRKNNILYEQRDNAGVILNVIDIKTFELTEYRFESKAEEVLVGLNFVDLRNRTRVMGKKDNLEFYKLSDEPNNLYIRPRIQGENGTMDQSGLTLLPIVNVPCTIYKPQIYDRDEEDPTCTISQIDFSKMCKYVTTIKCSYMMVHGFENGIIFKGILPTGAIGYLKEFGETGSLPDHNPMSTLKSFNGGKNKTIKLNIYAPGEIEKFKIDISTIKILTKIHSLSPNDTIKFYIQKNNSLKMMCNIGGFAKLRIFINSLKLD